jgi:hypothetical protein
MDFPSLSQNFKRHIASMNAKLFDAYVPTRTFAGIEVRLRSETPGAVEIRTGTQSVTLESSAISYGGLHFYRRTFTGLAPDTQYHFHISNPKTGERTSVEASTLPVPPGAHKLSIGVISDIHLSPERATIRRYRPGVKRLIGLAEELLFRYIQRLEALGADMIVLPGDLVDPCTEETLTILKQILQSVRIPCYPVIGNHEPWSPRGKALFHESFGLPENGFYTVTKSGIRLLMLSTPDPGALSKQDPERRLLEAALEETPPKEDIILVSHFSLLLHPCNNGPRNDGYQLLDSSEEILRLLSKYPKVRLFIAGHKNIPSMVTRDGIIHTLSPQLIQFPCGYDLFHLYEGGISRSTFEIDEQHYVETARAAYAYETDIRYGSETGRNFTIAY